ncbi:hypothetical protein BSKO_05378 [Bryopsis sp. KO-2023]|nr:hypothetical protein BSKO_05378 [Bryopsis sp. KO-2023]
MGNAVCCFAPEDSPRYAAEKGGHRGIPRSRNAGTASKTIQRTRPYVARSEVCTSDSRSGENQTIGECRPPKVVENLEDTEACRESGKGSAKSIEEGDVSGKRLGKVDREGSESPRMTDSSTQTQDMEEEGVDSAEGEEVCKPEKLQLVRKKRVVGDSAMLPDCLDAQIVESHVRKDSELETRSLRDCSEDENVEGGGTASVRATPRPSKNVFAAELSVRTVRDVTNEITACSHQESNSSEDATKPISNGKGRARLLSVELESRGSEGVVFEDDGESVTLDAVEDRGEVEERFYESSEMDTVDMPTTGSSAVEVNSAQPRFLMYSFDDDQLLASLPLNSLGASREIIEEAEGDAEERSFGTPRARVVVLDGEFEDLRPSRRSLQCHPLSMSDCTLLDSQSVIETEKQ